MPSGELFVPSLVKDLACENLEHYRNAPYFMVDINTDYGITSNPEELTALAGARTLGDLSREDYIQEMKRRGILRNELSLADNEDSLSVELA